MTGFYDRPADTITPYEYRSSIGSVVCRQRVAAMGRTRFIPASATPVLLAENGTADRILFAIVGQPQFDLQGGLISAASSASGNPAPAVQTSLLNPLRFRLMPGQQLWSPITGVGVTGALVTVVTV